MSQICVNESNLLAVGKMGKMGKMGMMGKKGDADFTNSAGCAHWDWGPIGYEHRNTQKPVFGVRPMMRREHGIYRENSH